MVDRFLLWLGAGAVCAGVTVGMLAGAGTAFAQTDPDGDGGVKTSQTTKPAENESDSGTDMTPKNQRPSRNSVDDTKPTSGGRRRDDQGRQADVDKNVTPERAPARSQTGPNRGAHRQAGQQRRRGGDP